MLIRLQLGGGGGLQAQEQKTHCNSSSLCQPSHQLRESTHFSFVFFAGEGLLLSELWTMVEMAAIGLPGKTFYFQYQCHLLLLQTVVFRDQLRKVWIVKKLKAPPRAQEK